MASRADCFFGGAPSKKKTRKWWYQEVAAAEQRLKFQAEENVVLAALEEARANKAAKEPPNPRAFTGYFQAYVPKPPAWAPSPFTLPRIANTQKDPEANNGRSQLRNLLNDESLIELNKKAHYSGLTPATQKYILAQYSSRLRVVERIAEDPVANNLAEQIPRQDGPRKDILQAQYDERLAEIEALEQEQDDDEVHEERPSTVIVEPTLQDQYRERPGHRFTPVGSLADENGFLTPCGRSFVPPPKAPSVKSSQTSATIHRRRNRSYTFDDRLMASSWSEAVGGIGIEDDIPEEREGDVDVDGDGDEGRTEGGDAEWEDDEDSDASTIRMLEESVDPAEGIAEYYERRAKYWSLDNEATRMASTY